MVGGYDLLLYSYPYRMAVAGALRSGRLPFWNPYTYAGTPLLANIPSAVFYPPNLLFAIWPAPQTLTLVMVLHVWLAGLLFYAFARGALEVRPPAAFFGATAFGLGGFSIEHSEQLNIGSALPWVPVVMLGLDRAYRLRSRRWAAVLAGGLALEVLAGHPQIVYYTCLLAAAWLAGLLLARRREGRRAAVAGLANVLLGAFVGLLVVAVQLLPTLELARTSTRAVGLPVEVAGADGVPVAAALQQLLSDYSRPPASAEWAAYVGLVTLGMAAVGLAVRCREPLVWILVAVSAAAVLIAHGQPSRGYDLAYRFLPGVVLFRAPSRLLLVTAFTLPPLGTLGVAALPRRRALLAPLVMAAALAAGGVAWLLQEEGRAGSTAAWYPVPPRASQLLVWVVLCSTVTLAVLLSGLRPRAAAVALCALSCFDLLCASLPTNPARPVSAALYLPAKAVTPPLPTAAAPYRSLSLVRVSDLPRPPPPAGDLSQRALAEQPDLQMRDGLASVDGYEGGILPLPSYLGFRQLLLPPGAPNRADFPFSYLSSEPVSRPLLQLLGVRYLVLSSPEGIQEARGLGYRQVGSSQGMTVFEDDQALPRAHLVGRVLPVHDDAEADRVLSAPGFDPHQAAALSGIACAAGGPPGNEAQLLRYEPEAVEALTESERTTLLVVSSADYPGWTAEVDGRPAPVGRVDGLLQGVCVPPGRHRVLLTFRPSDWPLALALSGLGLLALLALLLLRRRSAGEPEVPRVEPALDLAVGDGAAGADIAPLGEHLRRVGEQRAEHGQVDSRSPRAEVRPAQGLGRGRHPSE